MGLRGRLLWLVLLPAIPALLLAIYTNFKERQRGRTRVAQDAIRLAQLAAVNYSGMLEATRQHLAALAGFEEARKTNLAVFDSFFEGMRKAYPDYVDLGLIETNGDLVACSFRDRRPTNLASRAFFSRILQTREFTVGSFHPGDTKTAANLVCAYPVSDTEGHMVRILYAALDLAVLRRTAARSEIPPGAVLHLLDRVGMILTQRPAWEEGVGRPYPDPALLPVAHSRREGTAETRARRDDVRLTAFTSVGQGPGTNLTVCVGMPLSVAYAETDRMLLLNLAGMSLVASLALLAAWIYANQAILRPIRALAASTQRLTAGDLGARTGLPPSPTELGQLARAFDQMAETLEQQRLQNQHLQAELEDRVKERTAELEQSNRELEAFSYSVSHDLRAPLRHIHGFVQLLEEDNGETLTQEGHRLVKLISTASKRMGMLIDDLLAFSRMGRVELSRTTVNMSAVVEEVLQEIQRDTEGRQISWEVESLPAVTADRALLKQVWANLLSNAVKYTRDRDVARIRISASLREQDVEFRVADNGAGFDMRYAGKLFRVFERLHPAEAFEGTGIGLANVRRIILRHGGRTWAEGRVGEGATFYFTLPLTGAMERGSGE